MVRWWRWLECCGLVDGETYVRLAFPFADYDVCEIIEQLYLHEAPSALCVCVCLSLSLALALSLARFRSVSGLLWDFPWYCLLYTSDAADDC